MTLTQPDVKTLKRFRPLQEFDDAQLQQLANCLHLKSASNKQKLIELGSIEETSLFVLGGEVELVARDGKVKVIKIGPTDTLTPIAQLRPSMYDVIARSPLKYITIDKHMLSDFAQKAESGDEDISVHMIEPDDATRDLTIALYQDLVSDKVTLPSLPDVAQKIQVAFARRDLLDFDKLAAIVSTDPAMTGKLIKVSNSPLYQGRVPADTLPVALMRLGMNTTYKLVMAYAVNELFSGGNEAVRNRMQRLWSHSRKTAAISRILAGHLGGFDPDHAMLSGLVNDLGVIVILDYLSRLEHEVTRDEDIEHIIEVMRPQVTGMLMQKWNFSDEMVAVAEECAEWFRNPPGQADLCDLVLVARYHAMLGEPGVHPLPPAAKMPAMVKLGLKPQDSIDLIKQSQAEIAEIEQLL
jgi:HD-like signal output (HDOD) protein